jgi:NADPH:quinone reductase-like Zn-dependent oxidoreductase
MPMVGLTAWQALFDDAKLTAGQRVLINGAGGAVGGYAVQLAKHAGAHVVATGSPRSSEHLRAAGADEVVDHTTTDITTAIGEPVDVLLNVASISPEQLRALVGLVRSGGVVVNTVPGTPAPADEARGVRAVDVFVRSDTDQLSRLVAMVDRGELRVDVARRVALADLSTVHADASAGTLRGKVIVLPVTV